LAEQWLLSRWATQARVTCFGPIAVRYGSREQRRLALCLKSCRRAVRPGEDPLSLLFTRMAYAFDGLAIKFPLVTIDQVLDLVMSLERPQRRFTDDSAAIQARYRRRVLDEIARGRLVVYEQGGGQDD
jgi:hypothetical protein